MKEKPFELLRKNFRVIVTQDKFSKITQIEVRFKPELWLNEEETLDRPRFRIRNKSENGVKLVLERLDNVIWHKVRCSDIFKLVEKEAITSHMCKRIEEAFSLTIKVLEKEGKVYLDTPEKRHAHRGTLSGKKFGF